MDFTPSHLRSFLALAQEMHFGRAAASQGISAPSLSKQIAKLESMLGEALFERSPREVKLSDTGREFVNVASKAVAALDDTASWALARQSGMTVPLRIGVVGAGLGSYTTPVLAAAHQHLPGVEIHMHRIALTTRYDALVDGRVDLIFGAGCPLGLPDGVIAPIRIEDPRELVVCSGHRFADRESLTLAETSDETYIRVGGPLFEPILRAWMIDPRPDGTRLRWGPSANESDEVFDLVGAGFGVHLSVQSSRFKHARPELTWVPITDTPPGELQLTAMKRSDNIAVARLIDLAVKTVKSIDMSPSRS